MVIRVLFFFFKQKTAYEMRISDWSSDVCSSDLRDEPLARRALVGQEDEQRTFVADIFPVVREIADELPGLRAWLAEIVERQGIARIGALGRGDEQIAAVVGDLRRVVECRLVGRRVDQHIVALRSEEDTSELQSLMGTSNA